MALTAGLKGLWHMNNVWTDASGNGNNGTATGATFTTSSKLGSHAGSFDGIDDGVQIANEANFDFEYNQPFAIAGWVYPTSTTGYGTIFMKQLYEVSPGARKGPTLMRDSGGLQLRFHIFSTQTTYLDVLTTNDVLTLNAWNHIVMNYNGNGLASGVTLYVNNVLIISITVLKDNLGTGTILNNTSPNLGRNFYNVSYNQFWTGWMDEFGVWNRVLTANEISELYNGGAGIEAINTLRLRRMRCANDY